MAELVKEWVLVQVGREPNDDEMGILALQAMGAFVPENIKVPADGSFLVRRSEVGHGDHADLKTAREKVTLPYKPNQFGAFEPSPVEMVYDVYS
jgi:hypothetical protein